MKPAVFEYRTPSSIEETVSLLSEFGDEAKILAGGQSLVPAMNFRLARPEILVDIGGVSELDRVEYRDDLEIILGSRVTHRSLELNRIEGVSGRLFAEAARWIGHYPIRVRGTIGGSIAHADPAAEWCVLALALDAVMKCRNIDGERSVPAANFFDGFFSTELDPSELLESVSVPILTSNHRFGVAEFARRAGDFAIVLAVAVLEIENQRVKDIRLALGGVSGRPIRAFNAEKIVKGEQLSSRLIEEAAAVAAAEVDPIGDIHGSAEYRRDLVSAMVKQSLIRTIG